MAAECKNVREAHLDRLAIVKLARRKNQAWTEELPYQAPAGRRAAKNRRA